MATRPGQLLEDYLLQDWLLLGKNLPFCPENEENIVTLLQANAPSVDSFRNHFNKQSTTIEIRFVLLLLLLLLRDKIIHPEQDQT